jgi:hypothetical protein
VALAVATLSVSASAAKPRTAFCSKSGDVCYGVVLKKDQVYLQLTTVAKYFSTYHLCVDPPRGPSTCRAFLVSKSGQEYGSTVRWAGWFPNHGSGVYKVSWRLGWDKGSAFGPLLSFRH